jgi:hemerythrin
MLTKWDDKYSLHVKKIDEQHKELFRLSAIVENLNENSKKEEIKNLLNSFFNYMKDHFSDEEAYMKSIGYPLLKKHHLLHQEIIKGFTAIIKQNHTVKSIQKQMKIAIKKWLIDHIMDNDLKIEKWRLINS